MGAPVTTGELALWRAVYAAAWFQAGAGGPGHVTDRERAERAAAQATRAVGALQGLESDAAAEVLR
jgi:hypothetical protein